MSFFLRLSLCVVAALGAAQIVAGAVHNEVVVVAGAAPDGASLRPLPSPLVHAPVSSHAAMSFAFDPNDPEVQQYIRDRFGSSSHVAYVRRSIPRWGGPDEISADRDYLEEVIKTVAPGAALFVITILIWIVWGCITCCCGKPDPSYTKNQILVPMATGVVASLVVIAFCITGLTYTENFDSQISGNRGLGQNTLNVLSHVGLFFDRLDVSMQNVSVTVSGLTDDVKLQINSLNNPRPAFQHFLDDLRAFGSLTASDDPQVVSSTKPLSTSTTEYPCPACSALGTTIAQLASDIETQTNGPLNSIETVNKTAQDQVVNAQGTILNAIGQARDQIGTIKGRATSYNSNVADYKTKADDYEKNRRIGGLVIFIIPMAICVFFWLAIWRKSELIVKILIHFMFFFGALMWLLFMVHLPFTLLFADGCHYLDVNDPQLGSIESISSISGPLTACLSQHSLLDALDVADQLAFTNITQTMPTPPDVNAILNFTGFTQLNSTVQALDLATAFPTYDPQDKYNSLTQLNMLTTTDQLHPQQYFVLENVTDTDPSDVGWQNNADVQKWKYAVLDAKKAEAQLQAVLQGIKTNMTTVSYEYTSVKDQIRTLVDHFVGLSGALQPIVDAALGVKAQTFCNPLDQDYGDMKSLFCSEMIVSISGLAMASFFVGIFIFGVNVSGWFLIYRLAHGPGSVASQKPDEMYAVNNAGMQMQPMAVPVTPMSPNGADYQVASPNSQAHIAAGVVTSEGPTLSEMVAAQPSAPQEF